MNYISIKLCASSVCDLCFALYISKCIQISRSTAVSSYYTAAPLSPPASLSLSCISSVTHLTSKVFLGNTFSPSFHREKNRISHFLLSSSPVSISCCHRSSCKMFLSISFVLLFILFHSYISYTWSPLPPLHVI